MYALYPPRQLQVPLLCLRLCKQVQTRLDYLSLLLLLLLLLPIRLLLLLLLLPLLPILLLLLLLLLLVLLLLPQVRGGKGRDTVGQSQSGSWATPRKRKERKSSDKRK
jgi:hypothetical protein